MSLNRINATWAHETALEYGDNTQETFAKLEDDKLTELVLRRIENAAESGRFYIELNLRSPTDILYTNLRNRGFTVGVVLYQRDGEWTRVSW